MTLGRQLSTTITESNVTPDRCKACQRSGLPILPLRAALVPNEPGAVPANTTLGLRTLRAGYLYVLLDHLIWHAYQVTPEGYLRQFDPYAPPVANPASLASACVAADHDAPASFINIDTQKYATALLAFANDPWPASVLSAYKRGHADQRFQPLDLAVARNNPASVGLAITADDLQVDKHVFEYRERQSAGLNSVHGFHSRATRCTALSGFLRNAIPRHQLEQGILALVLDDSMGLVQEYNHLRNDWAQARQQWMSEPERAYQQQTSQILLAIRALNRDRAEQQTAPVHEAMTGDGPPVFVDPATERERIVKQHAQDFNARLEERYDEPKRAAFEAAYEQELARFQSNIDQTALAYAQACRSQRFVRIEQYDYDGNDPASAQAYSEALALCLRGGISEAMPVEGSEDNAPTAVLWREWLGNPQSPIYRALLRRDQHLLASLLPSFSATGDTDWNDSGKLYAAVTQAILSDEGELLVRAPLKDAMADLLGALNAASARLQMGPGVERAVSRLNSAAQLLYNRIHLTELKVMMKLSEYYTLQCEHLRNLQRKASEALGNLQNNQPHTRVRPLLQGGVLSLAVLDPKLAALSITVSVWVEGKITELQDVLRHEIGRGVDQLGKASQAALSEIVVGVGTLDSQARKLLEGMKVTNQQAAYWVRNGFGGLASTATSGTLLTALGSLYLLTHAMKKNLKEAEQVIGDKSLEAQIALLGSSMGVLGGGVEAVGLTLKISADGIQRTIAPSMQGATGLGAATRLGNILARAGAAIGATAGLYDATQAAIAAQRSFKNRDSKASSGYSVAVLISASAAGFGIASAVLSTSALMGPLGIAIVLGLMGYLIFKWAEGNESDRIERWVRQSFFGKIEKNPSTQWSKANQAHIAISELNAAILGLEIALKFQRRRSDNNPENIAAKIAHVGVPIYEKHLEYHLTLPNYDNDRCSYQWVLFIHRYGDEKAAQSISGEIVEQESFNLLQSRNATRAQSHVSVATKSLRNPDYRKNATYPTSTIKTLESKNNEPMQIKIITGAIELLPDTRQHNIESATLIVTFWPDREIHDAYAETVMTATH